jgi:uncharacterized protein (TIGR03437 family)
MSTLPRAILPALAGIVLHGQQLPYPTYVNPSALFVGGGSATITLVNQNYTAGLTALWNGSPRVTSQTSNGSYTVAVTASDLAAVQLAQIAMVNVQSGAVVDTVNFPVVYNVLPSGVAYDATRNLVYLATPAQPGDPTFPGNAVVALNVTSGKIGSVLQIGSRLGDLALSDDASALYVVVEGDNVVRRIDPSTFSAAGDFNFRPPGTVGTYPNASGYNNDIITVVPGKPDTVALAFYPDVGISNTQISIYDNGVPRPNGIVSGDSGFSSMLFSPDGSYFFQDGVFISSNTQNSPDYPVVSRYSVDTSGISTQNAPFASGGGATAIVNSTLYTALATAIDYTTMTVTGSFGIGGPIAVDTTNQRAYILFSPPSVNEAPAPPPELVAFSLASLETLGSQAVRITSIGNLNGSEKLIRFGVDGFIIPSSSGLLIFHTPLAGPAPATSLNAVVNAASQQSGPIAPGEILTIYGTNLGPVTPQSAVSNAGVFPSSLDNVQVWFGRLPGTPLLGYQGQINVVAPFELQPGTAVNLQVWYYGNPSAQISLPVTAAAPALFTQNGSGKGPVAVINQDGSINTASPAGTYVSLYGTGGGIAPNAIDGAVARDAESLGATASVTIGGQSAQVLYAGAAPGLVNGVFQLNVQLPANLSSGPAAIVVSINGQNSAQGATLEIR